MHTLSLDKSPPWSTSYDEDRRFRRILLTTLALCLVPGIITPYVKIPQIETDTIADPPPYRVRLLSETTVLTPARALTPTSQQTETLQGMESAPGPEQAVATPLPRKDIASVGVLAMKNKLSKLQAWESNTRKKPPIVSNSPELNIESSEPSRLTENLTRDSGGIEGGVDHHAVLGTVMLPDRNASVQIDLGRSNTVTAANTNSTARPATQSRSQEDIQEKLDLKKGVIYTLYNQELRNNPDLHGKLVMSITIAPQGHVLRCVILSSQLNSKSLERELVALVKSFDFGDIPGSTSVNTNIPIEFFPQ